MDKDTDKPDSSVVDQQRPSAPAQEIPTPNTSEAPGIDVSTPSDLMPPSGTIGMP